MINSSVLNEVALLRKKRPLVHCITNQVAMDFTANTLLALGASPLMAHAPEEMSDIAQIADALLLNIGTLDVEQVASMLMAGEAMNLLNKPIVLDPVGVGASLFRFDTAWKLIRACHPVLIRGNASEIMALMRKNVQSKGVDSTMSSDDAVSAAQALAQETHAVVIVSGETDYITDGQHLLSLHMGSSMMASVTAMGCSESAVLAAFAAVCDSPMKAAETTMSLYGFIGEKAASLSQGPASMRTNFIDLIYSL